MKTILAISFLLLFCINTFSTDFNYIQPYHDQFLKKSDTEFIFKLGSDTSVICIFNRSKHPEFVTFFDSTNHLIASGNISRTCVDCIGKGENWKEFYKNGIIKEEGDYYRNSKIGDWKYYFPNGKLKKLERIFFDIEGIEYYSVNPMLQSEYEYYENGILKMEGQYEKSYDCIDSIYVPDPETGIQTLYTQLGASCSKKCGTWNYYSPDGTLIKKEEE